MEIFPCNNISWGPMGWNHGKKKLKLAWVGLLSCDCILTSKKKKKILTSGGCHTKHFKQHFLSTKLGLETTKLVLMGWTCLLSWNLITKKADWSWGLNKIGHSSKSSSI